MSRSQLLFDQTKYEEWKWIPEFEGEYGCTKCGVIFSTKVDGWRIITGSIDKDGYRRIQLFDKFGKKLYRRVNRLVALTWLKGDNKLNVCHNDGDITNNHVSNLRFDTQHNNILDKLEHGTILSGENHPRVKLTEEDVIVILSSNLTHRELADLYNVGYHVIWSIRKGKSWKYTYDKFKNEELKNGDK